MKRNKFEKIKLSEIIQNKKCFNTRYYYYKNDNINKPTIIFFHGLNHSSSKYNYTFEEDGSIHKNYFLDKLKSIGNLLLYDRPEELIRFKHEEGSKLNFDFKYCSFNNHITQLHNFLIEKKINKPYILISHSFGSLFALKFAQKYSNEIKHVFLIDPIQFTKKVADKHFISPKKNLQKIINSINTSKKNIEKELSQIDSYTYSRIDYFIPKIDCKLTTFFNIDTKLDNKLIKQYVKELKGFNSNNYNNYFYYDRDHYLTETNPQGLVTKIKKELNKL